MIPVEVLVFSVCCYLFWFWNKKLYWEDGLFSVFEIKSIDKAKTNKNNNNKTVIYLVATRIQNNGWLLCEKKTFHKSAGFWREKKKKKKKNETKSCLLAFWNKIQRACFVLSHLAFILTLRVFGSLWKPISTDVFNTVFAALGANRGEDHAEAQAVQPLHWQRRGTDPWLDCQHVQHRLTHTAVDLHTQQRIATAGLAHSDGPSYPTKSNYRHRHRAVDLCT